MITKPIFELLIKEIESAGELAYQYFIDNEDANEQKSDGSVVTEIDKKIEEIIVTFVRAHFPNDSIVGEEGAGYTGDSGFVWHIDPIDGTDNFLRRIPFCAISVARLGDTDEDSFAVVHNPITQQTFSSFTDEGVREMNKIHILNNHLLGGRANVSIGRGRDYWMKSAGYNLQKALGIKLGKCSVYNCCALELAYIASNRIDGFLIYGLHSWDYAAGLYLIKSAGGVISVFENGIWNKWSGTIKELCAEHDKTIFASHTGIHDEALEIIANPRNWSDEK